jgi:hypothetical protein
LLKITVSDDILKELNEQAVDALKVEDSDIALESLRKCEDVLEVRNDLIIHKTLTTDGKDVDRNLIIVILYNLSCCFQR